MEQNFREQWATLQQSHHIWHDKIPEPGEGFQGLKCTHT